MNGLMPDLGALVQDFKRVQRLVVVKRAKVLGVEVEVSSVPLVGAWLASTIVVHVWTAMTKSVANLIQIY